MRRRTTRSLEMPTAQHRVNRAIRFPEVRVVDPDGEQLGVMSPDQARELASERGLDLVEVAPNARPPVCRIMDYGKFKYQQSKKAAAASASTVTVKTIQLRPKTDDHDLDIKLDRASKFLERGDKVRLVMRLRGRERYLADRWYEKLREQLQRLSDVGKPASRPAQEGRVITLMIEPN